MPNQADQLYDIVPALYRNRDNGDLHKYFRGTGSLLDQVLATLHQKQADNFPDSPLDGSLSSQEWLLPYFADLLDVKLVSPLAKGKREEIANAVRWRQSKGTLQVIEDIAEAIGQLEIIIQEGWQRVAVTPRLNLPEIPATAYGYSQDAPDEPPSMAAKHPGLPAVTPDFRCPSGAVSSTTANPAAQQTTVDGETSVWRQSSFHGAPCHPDQFDDVSPRTVDFRTSNWRQGHYHPDKIMLYMVPPAGFFQTNIVSVNWSEEPSDAFLSVIDVIEEEGKTIFRNKTFGTDDFTPVRVRKVIKLGQVDDGVGDADFYTWRFEGLVLENTVEADSGRVELEACAVRKIEVHSIDDELPVISAKNCLIKRLQAARSLSQLEYCTLLDKVVSEVINASDCIFLNIIKKDHPSDAPPEDGCIRYSSVPLSQAKGGMSFSKITRDKPTFFAESFGERSCAVLHPATSTAIRYGSADGGEMGAFHFQYLSLLPEAVANKLVDYLPLGLEAVVIPDEGLTELLTI
ncbi:hypothetical protein NBRC116494_21550 [Aurantivibrio plasticivorans]